MAYLEGDRPRRATRRGIDPLRLLRAVLVLILLVVVGWLGWLWVFSDWAADRHADNSLTELRERWAADTTPLADEPQLLAHPEEGAPEWIMTVPALDEGREWPVVVGTAGDALEGALAWYSGTAQPGQVGNFAVAGRCLGDGAPFEDLRELQPGATVLVEGRDAHYTYELVSSPGELTVLANQSWVLDPVPGHAEAEPAEALITLTTCEDRIATDDRTVGFGVLTSTELKQ